MIRLCSSPGLPQAWAVTLHLASKGVKALTLFACRADKLDEVANEIKTKFPLVMTLAVSGDATKSEDNERAVPETVKAFGGITSTFINAGVYTGCTPLTETTEEILDSVLSTKLRVSCTCSSMCYLPFAVLLEKTGLRDPSSSTVVLWEEA